MALGGYKSTENQPFRHRNDENNEGQNENYSRRQFFSGLLGQAARCCRSAAESPDILDADVVSDTA
jgi:hypothetical protein